MSEESNKDVFISYSRADEAFTRRLFDRLQVENRKPWVDWGGIPLSADWWNAIQDGIRGADTFIFVLSQNSLRSPVCHLEVADAISNNKRVVPLVIEEKPNVNEALGYIASYDPDDAMLERLQGRDLLLLARDNWKTLSKLNYVFLFQDDKDDKEGKEKKFEVGVKSLISALDTDLEYVKLHTSLLTDAHEWHKNNQNDSYLLNGDNLSRAEDWLASSGGKEPKPTELQTNYIVASRQAETKRQEQQLVLQRRATNRTRAFAGSVVALLVVGISLSLLALVNLQAARVASAQSESAGIAADALLQNDVSKSELTALLSIRALRSSYSVQAETALSRALDNLSTVRVFGPHSQRVRAVTFSKDGRTVLTASYDDKIRLWDTEKGVLLHEITAPQAVMDAAFSPNDQLVVGATFDGQVGLWDSANGQQYFMVPLGAVGIYSGNMALAVAFAPDGQTIAVGTVSGNLYFLDARDGHIVQSWQAHRDYLSDLLFSIDGSRIYSASGDGTIRAWDVRSGQELERYEGHTSDVMAIALSHDGTLLASGSADNTVRLWDVASATELRQFSGHTDTVRAVAFSPDDRFIASAGLDNVGRIWNVNTGEVLHYLVGHGSALPQDVFITDERDTDSRSAIFSVAYSPDGRYVLTGGWDGTARLWSNQERRYDAHSGSVFTVAFSPDSRYVLTGGLDTTVRLWEIASGQQIREYKGNQYSVYDVGFSRDGRYVYSAGRDGAVRVWVTDTGQTQSYFPITNWDPNASPTLYSAAMSRDGHTIVTGDEYGKVQIWDMKSNQLLNTLDMDNTSIYSVDYSSDESYLVTAGSGDALAKLWSFGLKNDVRWFSTNPPSSVWSASTWGDYMLVGLDDGTARLFNIPKYRQDVLYSGHTDTVTSVAFSPDGQFVLTGSKDRSARLWNRGSGQEVRQFVGHTDWIMDVAYSPDGRWVATASKDGSFRLWNANYQDFVDYACQHMFRDLTKEEHVLFDLPDTPTCPQFGTIANVAPTWTPIPLQATPAVAALPTILPTAVPAGYVGQFNSPEYISSVIYTPDGRYLIFSSNGLTHVLNASTLAEIRSFITLYPNEIAVSPDSNFVTVAAGGFPLRTWDIRTGLQKLTYAPESSDHFFAYGQDGKTLLSVGSTNDACCVHIWDTKTGSVLSHLNIDPKVSYYQIPIAISPDNQSFAVQMDTGIVDVWEINSQTKKQEFTVGSDVSQITFTPDGQGLVTITGNGAILWDIPTQHIVQSFGVPTSQGNGGSVYGSISANGQYLVLSGGGKIDAYNLQTGQLVQSFAISSHITALAFSPNNRSFAGATDGGTVYNWTIQ